MLALHLKAQHLRTLTYLSVIAGDLWRHGKDGEDLLHPGAGPPVPGQEGTTSGQATTPEFGVDTHASVLAVQLPHLMTT